MMFFLTDTKTLKGKKKTKSGLNVNDKKERSRDNVKKSKETNATMMVK